MTFLTFILRMNITSECFKEDPLYFQCVLLISYLAYEMRCFTLPDKRCLSYGMYFYQVMMTLHFLNDVAYDAK